MRGKRAVFLSAGTAVVLAVFLLSMHNPFSAGRGTGAVYFFYSERCPHCQAVKPAVFEIAGEKGIKVCEIGNMSADCKSVAERIGLRYVPTMVFMNVEVPEVFVDSDGVLKALEILKQS
ncbi:MAG: thioredoxin family protein [Candidatus Methanoglobus sp.]